MKNQKLKMMILLLLLSGISARLLAVSESEPNNNWNQADNITLGATATGSCPATGDIDWWKVTSGTDGKITINYTATNGLYVHCQLYDTLGVINLTGNYTNSTSVVTYDGLRAGTYYIRLLAFYSNESPSYSFSATWTTPVQANDVEPNDSRAQATALTLNSSTTGHIGYYSKNVDDTLDWYKVTTNKDGWIKLSITSHNGQYVYAILYDNDGTTQLAGNYTTTTINLSYDGLASGTYYIAVKTFYISEFAPYTLTDSLIIPPVVVDAEPNATFSQYKVTLTPGDSVVGHIGYYYNHFRDTLDWYKVVTTTDGQLNYTISSLNGQNVYLELFDHDGVSLLTGGSYTTTTANFATNGLGAGTYYLRVKTFYISEFVPYKIKLTQIATPVPIDTEPNGSKALAKTVNPNDSITGHVGYYYNHVMDTFDYRKIVVGGNGKIDWTIASLNGQYVYALLLDNDGVTQIGGGYTTTSATYTADGLAAGTYYMLIKTFYLSEFVPYYLKTKFSPVGNDPEPSSSYATAKILTLNDSLAGAIGYYYKSARDTNDWFKITTTNDGQVDLKLYILNGACVYLNVYDNNGTTVLYSNYSCGGSLSFSRTDLAKGTYYAKVNCFYTSDFAPYSLVNKLTSQLANDAESNNYAKNANLSAGYTTKTGHLNYYFNGSRDNADWYKLDYHNAENLVVTIAKSQHTFDGNYPAINYKLYADTALAPVADTNLTANTSYTHTYTTLATGTYYIKLTQYNNTYGAYTLTTNYRDTASATITQTTASAGTAGSCTSGKLTYVAKRGLAPYSVQLFLDGVAYGSAVITFDTAKFTSLPPGVYYAREKSAGASSYYKQSTTKALVPVPSGIAASTITGTTEKIKWNSFACVDGFIVSYKKTVDPNYTSDTLVSGSTKDTLKSLTLNTAYDYKIAAFVNYGGTKYTGTFSGVKHFTTPVSIAEGENSRLADVHTDVMIYPNPAKDKITVILNEEASTTITIYDMTGKEVMKQIAEEFNSQVELNINNLPSGMYMIKLQNMNGQHSQRFIKE